ncbi:MAG: hypothetical protein COT31_00470, partial [Candidatus Moranbacteria bacterium CG08_land_8_20_14_0_20_34_16]
MLEKITMSEKNKMDVSIFKAYDVRGLYPSQINQDTAYNIGQTLVSYTGAKKIIVGMDMRQSSPELENSLI